MGYNVATRETFGYNRWFAIDYATFTQSQFNHEGLS